MRFTLAFVLLIATPAAAESTLLVQITDSLIFW